MTAVPNATTLIVRTLAAGAWLEARPDGRLWCSAPARLPPELRHGLAQHRSEVWELVRAGENVSRAASPAEKETPA